MECFYCAETSEDVVPVSKCAGRCDPVHAHPKCHERRVSFSTWRNKHAHRTNGEFELCPRHGCFAKFQPLKSSTAQPTRSMEIKSERVGVVLQDPDRPCGFLAKDGLPCRRAAVANGACRFHAKDALVLRRMVETKEKEQEKEETLVLPQSVEEMSAWMDDVPWPAVPGRATQTCASGISIAVQTSSVKTAHRGTQTVDVLGRLERTVETQASEIAQLHERLRDSVRSLNNANVKNQMLERRLLTAHAARDAELLRLKTEMAAHIDRILTR